MRYIKILFDSIEGQKESICILHNDGSTTWFDHINDNPYKRAYDEWLEEGNTPEEWNPDIINNGGE